MKGRERVIKIILGREKRIKKRVVHWTIAVGQSLNGDDRNRESK